MRIYLCFLICLFGNTVFGQFSNPTYQGRSFSNPQPGDSRVNWGLLPWAHSQPQTRPQPQPSWTQHQVRQPSRPEGPPRPEVLQKGIVGKIWKKNDILMEFYPDGVFRYGSQLEHLGVYQVDVNFLLGGDLLYLGETKANHRFEITTLSEQRLTLHPRSSGAPFLGYGGVYSVTEEDVVFDDSLSGQLRRRIAENSRNIANQKKTLDDLQVALTRARANLRQSQSDEQTKLLRLEISDLENSILLINDRLEHLELISVRLEFLLRRLRLREQVQDTEEIFNQLRELDEEIARREAELLDRLKR